jgi:hypothetical protein
MNKRLFLLAALAAGSLSAFAAEATLDNGKVRVVADLDKGTYDLIDVATGQVEIDDAVFRLGDWSSADAGQKRTGSTETFADELGKGRRLQLHCQGAGRPELRLDIELHDGDSLVTLRAGLVNSGQEPVRILRYWPLAEGLVFPKRQLAEAKTLTAPTSCNQPVVANTPFAASPNNLLLTGKIAGQRRSLVLGALKTAEFTKQAMTTPPGGLDARCLQLMEAIPGARLAAYLPCTGNALSVPATGPRIRPAKGSSYLFPSQLRQAAVLYDHDSLLYAVEGLDPKKQYAVGFSWWDFNADGRIGSLAAVSTQKTVYPLVAARPLPQFHGKQQPPAESAALLPAAAFADGRFSLKITNENLKVPNIVASEIWLWEIPAATALPADWTAGKPVVEAPAQAKAGIDTVAFLEASDPVGRLVDPGETWMPADSFYLDFSIADPFAALEKYGLQLRAATGANQRHAYTFPTICAWYAGVWHTRGAQDHPDKSTYKINTTAGLVDEAKVIEKAGFLRYSPVAGRLVPDNYTANNPQGWWDNEHWQQHGLYTAPYETSQKFGQGMHDNGCLAFTYIQSHNLSQDFRKLHPDWLHGNVLDYSKPEIQKYLADRFAGLRGNLDGFMVDYCDEFWNSEISRGKFADPKMTATAFYRRFFLTLRAGIGPDARIHERNVSSPNNDLTLGIVDSQRTEWDTDRVSPALLSRSALRWYKNRVVIAYDMDSKELNSSWKIGGWKGSDEDGRRMLLTMAYVAASRLLTANSFRDLSPETIHDLSRTFPYPTEPKSARPIDAFVRPGTCPQIYDYAVTPDWHQVTFFNTALPSQEQVIGVSLAGDQVDGALGLDPAKEYYAYDFWNNRLVGKLKGTDKLVQTLRPGEARMLAFHAVEPNPQFISTNRHIMQGLLDLPQKPTWDAGKKTLSGSATVAANETFKITIATNGAKAIAASPGCKLEPTMDPNLVVLAIDSPKTATIAWQVKFE